jgi:hypothetical protein
MKEFISKWSNWWILAPKRKQLDDAFEKELNELIEREVALRIHDVVGQSELLKAFVEWQIQGNTPYAGMFIDEHIRAYFKSL